MAVPPSRLPTCDADNARLLARRRALEHAAVICRERGNPYENVETVGDTIPLTIWITCVPAW